MNMVRLPRFFGRLSWSPERLSSRDAPPPSIPPCPQVQERLTRQLAAAVAAATRAAGVMVVVECSHLCMRSRGVQKASSITVTDSASGVFEASAPARAAFLRARRAARRAHTGDGAAAATHA